MIQKLQANIIWDKIDALADMRQKSLSRLAVEAGLDPTSLNISKRRKNDGTWRWPSTELIARLLSAHHLSWQRFFQLADDGVMPLIHYTKCPHQLLFHAGGLVPNCDGLPDRYENTGIHENFGHENAGGAGWSFIPFYHLQHFFPFILGDSGGDNLNNIFAIFMDADYFHPAFSRGDVLIIHAGRPLTPHCRVFALLPGQVASLRFIRHISPFRIELSSLFDMSSYLSVPIEQSPFIAPIIAQFPFPA